MSTTGGMGRAICYHILQEASLLVEREEEGLLQQDNGLDSLSFALLRASIMSIRGARSFASHPASEGLQEPFDLSLLKVTCTEMVTIVFVVVFVVVFVLFFMFVFLMTKPLCPCLLVLKSIFACLKKRNSSVYRCNASS